MRPRPTITVTVQVPIKSCNKAAKQGLAFVFSGDQATNASSVDLQATKISEIVVCVCVCACLCERMFYVNNRFEKCR